MSHAAVVQRPALRLLQWSLRPEQMQPYELRALVQQVIALGANGIVVDATGALAAPDAGCRSGIPSRWRALAIESRRQGLELWGAQAAPDERGRRVGPPGEWAQLVELGAEEPSPNINMVAAAPTDSVSAAPQGASPDELASCGAFLRPGETTVLAPTIVAVPVELRPPHASVPRPAPCIVRDTIRVAGRGAYPCLSWRGSLEQLDPRVLAAIREAFGYLRDNASVYEHLASAARVALLVPGAERVERHGGEGERASDDHRGLHAILAELHIPFDFVPQPALADTPLDRYEALVCPTIASLSDAQARALELYVQAGGHLLGTGGVPSADARYAQRVERLLGLSCTGPESHGDLGDYLRVSDGGLFPSAGAGARIPVVGSLWHVQPLPGVTTFADLYPVDPEAGGPTGLFVARHARGEVAYLPWRIGASYQELGCLAHRQIVGDLLARWLTPLVVTDAPSSVELTLAHPLADPRRALVHLFNDTARAHRSACEVIELGAFSLWLRGRYAVARRLENGERLDLLSEDGGVRLALPRLGAWSAIELAGDGLEMLETV